MHGRLANVKSITYDDAGCAERLGAFSNSCEDRTIRVNPLCERKSKLMAYSIRQRFDFAGVVVKKDSKVQVSFQMAII